MGRIPKPEIERDLALIADYLLVNEQGIPVFSIAQLGIKYARVEEGEIYPLTASRIHQILSRHNVPKLRIVRKKKAKKRVRKSI